MKISDGKIVSLEFKVLDRNTKEVLEDTREMETFLYMQGRGQFLPKIEALLEGKEEGFEISVDLNKEEGYGEYIEELIEETTLHELEALERESDDEIEDDIYVGLEYFTELDDGSEVYYKILEIDGDRVVIDANHPFAGRDLRFEVSVVGVREATPEELSRTHSHNGCGCGCDHH